MADRQIVNLERPELIVGNLVAIRGIFVNVIPNGHTKAVHPGRQWQIVLSPVSIGGFEFDHLCVPSTSRLLSALSNAYYGDEITFIARSRAYEWRGEQKIGISGGIRKIQVRNQKERN